MTPPPRLADVRTRIYADVADIATVIECAAHPLVRGFTTNPTLLRKAAVQGYERFAKTLLERVPDRPVSLGVLADDFAEMERQARVITTWGPNVYVKIPITDTHGTPARDVIRRLAHSGIKVNVTAVLSLEQAGEAVGAVAGGAPSCISIFAGRIADTGRDPGPVIAEAVNVLRAYPRCELIWASARELLNVFQASAVGCHIITVTAEILRKLELVGKDLRAYSLETVRMFHRDAEGLEF